MFWKNDSSYEDVAVIEYMDNLFSYAMVLTRNRGEAEDLVQETYLRAMRAMTRLRAGSNVKSWLLVILRNIWLNQLRKQRTTPKTVEIDVDDISANVVAETSKGPHALYVSKRECEQVREAIQHLPVDFREVILLREYEELSYQEIVRSLYGKGVVTNVRAFAILVDGLLPAASFADTIFLLAFVSCRCPE
jgi:RNA polymerase sigma-70 factor (ECF subfamily)